MTLLRNLLLSSALIFCTSAQGPVVDPVDPVCDGCSASVTFSLPASSAFYDLIDDCGNYWIDWTVTRDIATSGRCGFVEAGSCVQAKRCLASGRAVGTVNLFGVDPRLYRPEPVHVAGRTRMS